jgi:signal transduction histidine kinase
MPGPGNLTDVMLEQSPACHWIVKAGHTPPVKPRGRQVYGEITFERVWGDTDPLFGKSRDALAGAPCGEALSSKMARVWRERFERTFEGEGLSLRERRSGSVWYVSLFPMRVEGDYRYAAGIGREITPWGTAEQELRHTVLAALKAQEFERTIMARFLHDSVGQNLTAIGLQLDLIRMDLDSVDPKAGARIAEVQVVLGEMMESVRGYSYELNPATVERAGLRLALDRLAARSRERFTGTLRVNVDPSLKIEPKLASAMYQVAQEAVENSVQHSGCTAIDISLKTTRTGTILEVRDNGRGFDPDDIMGGHRGLGLLSMEHYAAQAGLELSIASTREAGTVVRAVTG